MGSVKISIIIIEKYFKQKLYDSKKNKVNYLFDFLMILKRWLWKLNSNLFIKYIYIEKLNRNIYLLLLILFKIIEDNILLFIFVNFY